MKLASILNFLGLKKQPTKSKEEIEMDNFLEEWNNRIIYEVLTKEILDTVSNDDLEQTVFDNILKIIGDDYKNEFAIVQKLSTGQQSFWATWILEGEVNNGGFNQFYFNSSGQYAEMAETGFRIIGAEKYSQLTSNANDLYVKIKDKLEKFNDGTLESFGESYKDNPLNKLDDEFYDLEEQENISKLRIQYIRNYPQEFTTV